MKPLPLAGVLLAIAAAVTSSYAGPADDVKAAARKLSESGGYSWKTTVESAGGGGGGGRGRATGPTEGKASKDGVVFLKMSRGDTTTRAVLQGTRGVVETNDGWQTLADLADSEPGRGAGGGRFLARTLQNFKAPASQAEELAGQAKELRLADGVYSGDLTPEGARALLSRGGRGGGGGANVSNARGTVKFWVKDGVLSKYQYQVQGTVSTQQGDRERNTTTTVEITDVGATTVEVPEAAKKKLS